jgi:cytidine deaminase
LTTDEIAGGSLTDVDWPALRSAAVAAARNAYAPYSSFPVGAAALADDGRLITGCNVENASYGLGLCAECAVVSALFAGGRGGARRLVALACVGGADAQVITPCGRCRQLLWEHGGPGMLVQTPAGVVPLADLLPQAFGPANLGK